MGRIELEGLQFYGYHGHFEAERKVGNYFRVDVQLETDCSKAAVSDKLSDALNYQEIYSVIKKEMQISSNLLENVAQRIVSSLFGKFPEISFLTIKVSKLNPSIGGEIGKVSVTLSQKSIQK